MATCACDVTLENTGRPNCSPISGVASTLVLVNYKDDSGAINFLDTTGALGQTEFDALVNNADKSKRWFPVKGFENVEDLKADPIFESLNSGANVFIQDGPRTFTGMLINHSPTFLGKIINARCTDLACFIIDKDGNVIGNGSTAGRLDPIRIDSNTWNPQLMKSTDTTSQKVSLTFEFNRLEKDEDLRMVASSETTIDMLEVCGLIDVNGSAATITTTSFELTATFDYGTQVTKQPFKGAVAADFALNEITPTPGVVAILTAVESPDGVYTITYAAQTPADVLELTLNKDGFEMTAVSVTIP
jgi:hypothetical protein